MPLPPTPAIPGLDTGRLDELRDLDPGDTTYLDRAIGNFARNSSLAPEAFRELILAGDAPGLRAAAHKLLGGALNLGATVAVECLRAVESHAERGTTDGADALVPSVDGALRRAREQLALYQATYAEMVDDREHTRA